jgi:hypothetical protein
MKSTAIIFFAIIFSSFATAGIAAGFGGGKVQNAIKSNDINIWGNAVDGVAVRLIASKKGWTTNEVPTFHAIVRNNDVKAHGSLTAWQAANRLELDDEWYTWKFDGPGGNIGRGTLQPNNEAGSDVTFDPHWHSTKTKEPLQISPGTHIVHFAVWYENSQIATNIISNPVEIEIKSVGTSIAPTNHI